ncbi:MAG: PIN domain-containing protein [Bacteroidetes bacterium]|nr:PIN domain-containing protein [Bacteroidota bacterium]
MQKPYRLYLDNCCFNRPFDNQEQLKIKMETEAKLYVQNAILLGKYELVWSYILEFENNQNPYKERRNAIYDWKKYASVFCVENERIISFAGTLYKKGIKVKDALHIACAVETDADFFITTDKKLINTVIPEIRVINPLMVIDELNI